MPTVSSETCVEDILPQLANHTEGIAVTSEGKIIGVVNADSVVAALAQESNTRNHAEAMDIIMSPEQPKAQPHEC
jgi:predicted transcriptional regulator